MRVTESVRLVSGVLLAALVLTGCSTGSPADAESAADPASASSSTGPAPGRSPTRTPGASASGAVLPATSATPTLRPPSLPTLRGYRYTKAPAPVVAAFLAAKPVPPGVLRPPTVVSVMADGMPIGSVAARTLDPAHVGETELENSLLTSLTAGLAAGGYTVRTRKVTGGRVITATRTGSTVLTWYHRGVVLQLVSSAPAETPLEYAEAYLAR
ncbi:MAG: hypothetical protein JNL54_07790 [Kineosporiaceae bacterium]|nr:hypothetical protein [Kineosporiaceae bacterium]